MKHFPTSIQRRRRGKRTEYFARLTYYDKTGKRKGVSKSAATHWDAKRELQDLIDQHVAGGPDVLEARNMTFAALGPRETRTVITGYLSKAVACKLRLPVASSSRFDYWLIERR
jgi:hypothetical protein